MQKRRRMPLTCSRPRLRRTLPIAAGLAGPHNFAPTKSPRLAIAPTVTQYRVSTLHLSDQVGMVLTNPAYINNPLETALTNPTVKSPTSLAGSYNRCTANPIACPIGVVTPYIALITHGFRLLVLKLGMAAMRDPSASPSNV